MAKSFDDILKEGKKKVSSTSDKHKDWKKRINNIMEEVHALNKLYGHDNNHHLKLEDIKCKKCKVVAYVLAVRDIKDNSKVTRFHKSKWKPLGKNMYYCNKCRGK